MLIRNSLNFLLVFIISVLFFPFLPEVSVLILSTFLLFKRMYLLATTPAFLYDLLYSQEHLNIFDYKATVAAVIFVLGFLLFRMIKKRLLR
jgi:hypothetical protein